MKRRKIITRDPKETFTLGVEIGRTLRAGDFVALEGDLGAGKTLLTKGIAKGLGVKDYRHVNSPSFVILKVYDGKVPLYHFDVYRLSSAVGLDTVGYEDYFYGSGVCVVEWANKVKEIIPAGSIKIKIVHAGEKTRKITVSFFKKGHG